MSKKTTLHTLEQTKRFTLKNASDLHVDLYPNGAVCAFRHQGMLINQALGVAPEGAPFRLWLRDTQGGISLVGPATAERFGMIDDRHAMWQGRWQDVTWLVQLIVDERETAWTWRVHLRNESAEARTMDAVLAQDLGLAAEGGVRSNEAYASHYIDHTILTHPQWGPVICSRQNLGQAGKHPWIAHACTSGAAAFATDAIDVFGLDQRARGKALILAPANLPSVRRQAESACAALQSNALTLEPGEEGDFTFVAYYVPDHPDISSDNDLKQIARTAPHKLGEVNSAPVASVWDDPVLYHGDEPDAALWNQLYPERQHEEWRDGVLWSFFTQDGRHVVSKLKEVIQERSHGHVLCASDSLLPESNALGTTVYASGVFNAQVYLENPNTARLLSVIRDPLQRVRGAGQRIWIDGGTDWQLLGTPTLFEMGMKHAAWRYVTADRTLEIRTHVESDPATITLSMQVVDGAPVRWRVTHQLALDGNELDSAGSVEIREKDGQALLTPDPKTLAIQRCPELQFRISGSPKEQISRIGTDEMIWQDGSARGTPYLVIETGDTDQFVLHVDTVAQTKDESPGANAKSVSATQATASLSKPGHAWRITEGNDEVMALADILPWFRHDAWIHLASPHGLEQYGGAAWGVRDVCQGPLEWLITEQRYDAIKSILLTVFSHQYEDDGLWPQWFMLGRYADIQQRHCHGDIMFWPLKALCDYAEAANDPGILDMEAPFTRAETFQYNGRPVPLSEHVQRVVTAYQELCIPGTALVSYGDGDWDDTLQPVRTDMRENMVSAWTVQLAYQVFGQLEELYRRVNRDREAESLADLRGRIRADFMKHLMPDGIVAGFAVFRDGKAEPLLHPRDRTSGIQYRLLPMTRGMLSGMFDEEQTRRHCDIIHKHLRYPDGVRLMDRPVPYTGGISRMFQRAETAAYFGREVSLQYVHAHLRYAEAMACVGNAEEAWWALQAVNPLGLCYRLPNALPRQANVYFSSSDGDFLDRYQAGKDFEKLRSGEVGVKGGWRLYSSGPGLYLHKVRCSLMGIREHYGELHFDPVLPGIADGLTATMKHEGHDVTICFKSDDEAGIRINGSDAKHRANTSGVCRDRGMILDRDAYRKQLKQGKNSVEIRTPSMRSANTHGLPECAGASR